MVVFKGQEFKKPKVKKSPEAEARLYEYLESLKAQ